MSEPAKNPLKLFYCYAHEDKDLRDTLDRHLAILKRQNLLEIFWYDREISPGMEWEHEIDKHLSSADIVLLLVSADFLDSEYCYGKEMKQALQRHEEGMVRVVPIILRPVYWEDAPFSKLQILPTEAKPVTNWRTPDDACEDIAKSLRGVIKELQALHENKAKEAFQKGVVLNEQQCWEDAIVAFDQTIRFDPNNVFAYADRGLALRDLKRYEEAIAAFDQYIRLKPNDAEVYKNKGIALKELKRYEEAIAAFDQFIRLNPNDAEIYNNKGIALKELRQYNEAIQAYDQAIQLKPKHATIRHNRGNALEELGWYEEAFRAYDEAIQLNPNDPLAYIAKGIVSMNLKHYRQAIEAYDQALRLNPKDAVAYYLKGFTLSKLKRYKEASSAFSKASSLANTGQIG